MQVTNGMLAAYVAAHKEVVSAAMSDYSKIATVAEDARRAGIAAALSAALSIEQTEPVAWRCKDFADGWILDQDERSAREYQRKTGCLVQPLYAAPPSIVAIVDNLSDEQARFIADAKDVAVCRSRIRSALVNAQADADVVERWQPIETAPKDGTPIDLWGVNHLHPRKTGRRATDVTWGRVRDWLGNERDDWQHGQGEDFEPTHWCPVPAAPLSSLRPAEVGSATDTSGTGGGE